MAKQTKAQEETVARVMHEFKHGELRTGGGKGPKVRNPKQAVAIALHEAGATNQESPKTNRENLRRIKAKERRGETARDEAEGRSASQPAGAGETRAGLYREAQRRDVPGRSKMNKEQLERALRK